MLSFIRAREVFTIEDVRTHLYLNGDGSIIVCRRVFIGVGLFLTVRTLAQRRLALDVLPTAGLLQLIADVDRLVFFLDLKV